MTTAPRVHPLPALVSVIIPVRNGAATLGEQLEALAGQDYDGAWEVVVADNGSTDGTGAIVDRFATRLPKVTTVDASERAGSSYARNCGAQHAAGDFLAFCDADDVVVPGWLAALTAAAQDFDAVTGVQDATSINSAIVQAWRPARAAGLPQSQFLPYAPSCNLGVWSSVFRDTGGFDEGYPQSHDVEWSWRAQLASFTLGFAPGATVHYRYRTNARGVWRQAYLSGLDASRLYRDYRSRGLRRESLGRALRVWAWVVVRTPWLLGAERRGTWIRRTGEAVGRLSGSAQFRVLYL
jgi:glycosyltransferase involved in cell wall biosynthesis